MCFPSARTTGAARRRAPVWMLMLAILITLLPSATARAQEVERIDIDGPPGTEHFGTTVAVLPNGNFVVTDPQFDNGAAEDAGAVFLYDGRTLQIISMLVGRQKNDLVGIDGITVLANGNFVVATHQAASDTSSFAGLVTWGSATTGFGPGVVAASPANSLAGTAFGDAVGKQGVIPLANGNYLVVSQWWSNGPIPYAGAVTFGDGTRGVKGYVSAANSLVGDKRDQGGGRTVVTLPNGNYVVVSPQWPMGDQSFGAVTFGNGKTGTIGTISVANSLVGSAPYDLVGSGGIEVLSDGNYVLASPNWNEGRGAATWANGTTPTTGVITTTNSLVGTRPGDQVSSGGVAAAAGGRFVVGSPQWDGPSIADAGAATWIDAPTQIVGTVAVTNSLVGSQVNDWVGASVTGLANGHYVVCSPEWGGRTDWHAFDLGAATWANGAIGLTGVISTANSLIGSEGNSRVCEQAVALTNGNYVVLNANSATWGDGTAGTVGIASDTNSLITGSHYGLLPNRVVPLTNGNYVVVSPNWYTSAVGSAGSVTWGDGTRGTAGVVSTANSLIGTHDYDQVGGGDVFALSSGDYVVSSPEWHNGALEDAGAVTWGRGTGGTAGGVSAVNSMVGTAQALRTGWEGVFPLAGTVSDYIVLSQMPGTWLTWADGTTLLKGTLRADTVVSRAVGSELPVAAYNNRYGYLVVGGGGVNRVRLLVRPQTKMILTLYIRLEE